MKAAMKDLPSDLTQPLVELLLSIADDKFILGHRNADWTGLAPILEEDIAFSSLAQDDIAHAAALYGVVAELTGGDANRLAYGRKPEQYRCCELVELADDFDWSVALVRQFFCDHCDAIRLERLSKSRISELAALAVRMRTEEGLSLGHADGWIVRLGRAGDEARGRMQAALDRLAPLTAGLFEPTEGQERLEAGGVFPPGKRPDYDQWRGTIEKVVSEAGLRVLLSAPAADFVGGRRGRHGAGFAAMLDELAEVYRVEPEAAW